MRYFHTAIYDFDNTLFDTEVLKQVYLKAMTSSGLNDKEAYDVYVKVRDHEGIVTFAIPLFSEKWEEALAGKGTTLSDEKKGAFLRTIEASMKTLDGGIDQLDESKARGHKMYLLSLGVQEYQHRKMEVAGVKQYFSADHIICPVREHVGKLEALQSLFSEGFTGEGVVLFNDKPGETAKMLRAFPSIVGFVPRSIADERYTEDDFHALVTEFGNRVTWKNSMREIHEEFLKQYPRHE